ncbi:MAG: cobalamin biosynthesis protein, partial [Candidatus Omnitrophica bacterium]|nr:cobalamin biosynthesis protein [Candidatus Omnitrophota bacterium]
MEIVGAFILDLIFGDPRWLPHPVRGIGWAIEKLERILYRERRQRVLSRFVFRRIARPPQRG